MPYKSRRLKFLMERRRQRREDSEVLILPPSRITPDLSAPVFGKTSPHIVVDDPKGPRQLPYSVFHWSDMPARGPMTQEEFRREYETEWPNRRSDGLESLLIEARAVATDGYKPDQSERDAVAEVCDRAKKVLAALKGLARYVEGQECQHEETHRGGTIWTICDGCGRKWADDQGGFVPYQPPSALREAVAAIAQAEGKAAETGGA